MLLTSTTTLLLSALALAGPVPSGHEWRAPGPNAVRSPCPGLNTLANHGWIHRNGKNMTIPHLIAGGEGMNIGADFMTAIGGAGILSHADPAAGYFDLDDLREHDFPIEHDGSLSRNDKALAPDGNWYDLRPRAYLQWMNYFGDAKKTSIRSAANARYTRIKDSLKRNPQVAYGPREFILSYGETGLYLQTMGMSVTSGVARLDYVRSLFVDQRLPYEKGWSPPKLPVTLLSLANMAFQLNLANKEQLPEGLQVISLGAFQDAFAGKDPVTHKLANVTSGLLDGGSPFTQDGGGQ